MMSLNLALKITFSTPRWLIIWMMLFVPKNWWQPCGDTFQVKTQLIVLVKEIFVVRSRVKRVRTYHTKRHISPFRFVFQNFMPQSLHSCSFQLPTSNSIVPMLVYEMNDQIAEDSGLLCTDSTFSDYCKSVVGWAAFSVTVMINIWLNQRVGTCCGMPAPITLFSCSAS